MSIEKRQFPRMPCALPAAAEGPRGPVRGTCTNVSLGGAFLEGVQLPVNAPTRVTLSLPGGGELSLDAQVVRHAQAPRGMGVQFMRLDPERVKVLQQLVARFGG